MQDRYTGDIGDFGKYGLLRFLCLETSLRLGVNWYFVDPKELNEESKEDGRYTQYLQNKSKNRKFRCCDEDLYKELQAIIRNKARMVREIEQRNILPKGTVFYNRILSFNSLKTKEDKEQYRSRWAEEGYKHLKDCKIVFFDPDNGLQIGSCAKHHKKGIKYAFYDEIEDYYKRGQSLIIYNHKSREKKEKYQKRFNNIKRHTDRNIIPCLRFHRFSVRDFVFILQPKHRKLIGPSIKEFLKGGWGKEEHFTDYKLKI